MIPIDFNGFWSSFTPKTRDVSDITRTRGGFVYHRSTSISRSSNSLPQPQRLAIKRDHKQQLQPPFTAKVSPKTKKPCFNIQEQGEVPSGTRPGLSPIYVQVNPKPPARTSSGATQSTVESVPTQNNPSNVRTGESLLKQNSTSSKSQTSVMSVAQVSTAEPTPPPTFHTAFRTQNVTTVFGGISNVCAIWHRFFERENYKTRNWSRCKGHQLGRRYLEKR